jgi:acetoin utilization protein AcuB
MSHPVIKIYADVTIHDALDLMRKWEISHLPVVDRSECIIGMVSERDLLFNSPADVSGWIKWELAFLRNKSIVHDVMSRDVHAVEENVSVEEAARIMTDNAVDILVVVQNEKVVGIITESDLLTSFTELLGTREPGIHIDMLIPDKPGILAKLTKSISDIGGSIVALESFTGDGLDIREVSMKVTGVNLNHLKNTIKPHVTRFIEVHEPQFSETVELW